MSADAQVTNTRAAEANRYLTSFPARPIQLEPGRAYSIGRAEGNNIVLADADVSRNHAIVSWQGEECILRDLGSRNGCYINGERVEGTRALAAGDLIKIGIRIFTFMVKSSRAVKDLHDEFKREKQDGDTEILDAIGGIPPSQGLAGSMADFGLPELIQTLELNKKTGILTVVGDEGRGIIWVREGVPVAATFGTVTGEEAFYSLLAFGSGYFQFDVDAPVTVETQIETNIKSLLMETFRRQDEKEREEAATEAAEPADAG